MFRVNNRMKMKQNDDWFHKFMTTHSDSKKVLKFLEKYNEFVTKNRIETENSSFFDDQTEELISHLSKIKHNITNENLCELFYMVWVGYNGENRKELFENFLSFLETRIKVDDSDEEYTVFRVGTIDGRSWSQNIQSLTFIWNTWVDFNNEFTDRKRKFLQPRVYKRIIKKSDILFHSYKNERHENEFILRKKSLRNNNNVSRCEVVSTREEFYFSDEENVYGVHCKSIDDTPFWIPQNDNWDSLIVNI
jgi:hypothetical protein